MRKGTMRKFSAIILTLAMVLTSITWPDVSQKASAEALTLNDDEYDATNILTESGDVLVSSSSAHVKSTYNGYILSNTGKALTSKYLKITYTIEDTTSLTEDSILFDFQPYTVPGFQGWQDNFIKFGDAIPTGDNSYKSYISVRDIKASMDLDQTCGGINILFYNAEPTITLTGYYALTIKSEKNPDVEKYDSNAEAKETTPRDILTITGTQMADAGVNVSSLTATSVEVTPYIQVTKAHNKSSILISCVEGTSNSSNKALVGTAYEGENNSASATNYVIHCGYGTEHPGTGIGAAGTGIYNKIPSLKTNKWSGKSASEVSIRLRIETKDTECKLLGIVFGNGEAFTVNDDGSITKGFNTAGIVSESQTPDSTDVKAKSQAELKWEAEEELWWQLRSAKALSAEDCLTEEFYDALQEAIAEADAAIDDPEATPDSLKAALESLQAALKNATYEPPVGLKKAIDYCKSLNEEDYSSESFAKLAPAIAAAEAVYDVYGTKTDAELKAARDALEKVRVALVPNVSTAESNPKDFRILSKTDVVKEMGAGINLGNTMDGGTYAVSETSWQTYKTTKAYIKALHDAGYNTVRIPVTWGEHINDDYSIREAWIGRVQEIVDYCVDQDMYAIINIHHDGAANHDNRGNNTPDCWLDTYQWDIEKVYQKYAGVWKTIANRFKDYDEHLIFESMNEVTDAHTLAAGQKNEDDDVLNALNQLFINTVRATGSNNTKRWLAITGRFATTNAITKMPEDTLADKGDVNTTRLMFSVHIYKDNSSTRWSYDSLKTWQSSLSSSIKNVQALDKNMPLYVGEYGVRTQKQTGSATGYNNAERALNYEVCADVSDFYGAVPIVWDQGTNEDYAQVATETGLFTDWNRPALEPVYDDVVHGTIRGTYLPRKDEGDVGPRMIAIYKSYGHSSESDNSVSTDPEINEITDIALDETTVNLVTGERKNLTATVTPSDTNDVLLWSTDNDAIVTVSQGRLHAKNAGVTYIHAYSQSKSVTKDIRVIVTSNEEGTATAIQTDEVFYQIEPGEQVTLNATLTPADSQDAITYSSSNPEVATVNSSGVVTAEKIGNAYIIVTAASGVSTIVKIRVSKSNNSKKATAMTATGENIIRIPAIGEEADIEVALTPVDTDSLVAFYSTDSSVVAVETTAKAVNAEGKVKVSLTGISEGVATVTAITENGLKVFWSVGVGVDEDIEIPEPTDPTPSDLDGPPEIEEKDPESGDDGDDEEDTTPTPKPGTTVTPTPKPGTTVTPTPQPETPTVTVKKVTLKKVKSTKKKTIVVQWKKASDVTGYEIQVATNTKFTKGLKKYTIKKAKTTKKTIKKLKSKKKYYVRIRAYKTVSGKKYIGKWSTKKNVKVK